MSNRFLLRKIQNLINIISQYSGTIQNQGFVEVCSDTVGRGGEVGRKGDGMEMDLGMGKGQQEQEQGMGNIEAYGMGVFNGYIQKRGMQVSRWGGVCEGRRWLW